jgi:hypothetical protein
MKKYLIFSAILLLSLAAVHAPADKRTEPMDVIIALDRSLSMEGKIKAEIAYVNDYLIDQLLIPGDYFLVVAFYGKTEIPVALRINSEADKQKAKAAISKLVGNGRFTDIGNALDVLGAEVQKLGDPGRKKYLLLLTDGIQEAPHSSKYYSPDGKFTHAFLENTKTIQKKGWKIMILGVGTHEEAQALANDLAAEYSQVSETPTKEEFIAKTQDFLASIALTQGPQFEPVDALGRGRIRFTLRSTGYTQPREVRIGQILLSLPGSMELSLLPAPATLSVPPDAPLDSTLWVRIVPRLPAGDYSGTLQFQFAGEGSFSPVAMPVSFRVQSIVAGYWSGYWYWILIAAAAVALIVVLIVLLARRQRKVKVRFRPVLEGRRGSRQQKSITIAEGVPLFLELSEGGIRIVRAKSEDSLARLAAISKGIRMTVLKPERFVKLRTIPQNVLDAEFKIRTEEKKEFTVRLASVK